MTFRPAVTLGLLAGLMTAPAFAETRPKVVELFTSQGCSSCPPADRLLGELARRPDILALAYHVDYWDGLGWKDPFSLPAATRRQRAYAQALGLRTIYTPQMVVDGRADVVGSDRPAVLAHLDGKAAGLTLHLTRTAPAALRLDLEAAKLASPAEITVITYSRQEETMVSRGENAGKRLAEYAVVRDIRPLGPWEGEARSLIIDLSALRGDGSDIAILVQERGQGPVLAATRLGLY